MKFLLVKVKLALQTAKTLNKNRYTEEQINHCVTALNTLISYIEEQIKNESSKD